MHVERVDISWLESLTLEGRASYYDGAGALKDMIQNHLMEAMALLLMEQPARLDADSFRSMRVEALRTVATPSAERMRSDTIRARYTAGEIGSRRVPSYVDEPGVDANRNTETYASLTVGVNSPRWDGVPFTLRSGKALEADSAEIAIHFRPLPRLPDRPVSRGRAERAQDRSPRTVRAARHDPQRPRARRPRTDGSRHDRPRRGSRPMPT